jgi:hypothetical protein
MGFVPGAMVLRNTVFATEIVKQPSSFDPEEKLSVVQADTHALRGQKQAALPNEMLTLKLHAYE